ncbi:hypothetical protein GALL_276530 [mine drainage metagenome]|uniref:Uncharacterized protein n=1 Tax=mine drainage metagenome TaxID=410659 RepID=A0A1J5R4T5_9ZZZZ
MRLRHRSPSPVGEPPASPDARHVHDRDRPIVVLDENPSAPTPRPQGALPMWDGAAGHARSGDGSGATGRPGPPVGRGCRRRAQEDENLLRRSPPRPAAAWRHDDPPRPCRRLLGAQPLDAPRPAAPGGGRRASHRRSAHVELGLRPDARDHLEGGGLREVPRQGLALPGAVRTAVPRARRDSGRSGQPARARPGPGRTDGRRRAVLPGRDTGGDPGQDAVLEVGLLLHRSRDGAAGDARLRRSRLDDDGSRADDPPDR